jgi:hypothetical protein
LGDIFGVKADRVQVRLRADLLRRVPFEVAGAVAVGGSWDRRSELRPKPNCRVGNS